MVKHFLIDGYNLAHKLGVKITKDNLQQAREAVERKVATLTAKQNRKCTLVFDGRGVLGATEQRRNVSIVFTASGESADARIKKMIDEAPNKSALCVVSSDNEILRYAKVSRAQSMRSEEFLSDLNAEPKASSKPKAKRDSASPNRDEQKPNAVSSSDIEEWKKIFQ